MTQPTRMIRLSEIAADGPIADDNERSEIAASEGDSAPTLRRQMCGGAVSIGNFDGVHAGHRELLRHVRQTADDNNSAAIAVVLDPHPAAVLRPHSVPPRLTTIERRAELMSEIGIDFLLVCPTTIEFLNRTAEQFFDFLIRDHLDAQCIVEGPNFFFGRDRGGDIHRLRKLCERSGRKLQVVEPCERDQRMISSSRIREAISSGKLTAANDMLRSIYQFSGRVTRGEGRGRSLGFPTANLSGVETLVPEKGVYAARVLYPVRTPAAVHIGPNPTFDDQRKTKIEIHLLDYHGDLYEQQLTVALIDRVREVQKFGTAQQLTRQLELDIQRVRQIEQTYSLNP